MEQLLGLNRSEQQLVFDMVVMQVETYWDTYDSVEDMEREEVYEPFIGSCRLVRRYEKELGWDIPKTRTMLHAMAHYDWYLEERRIKGLAKSVMEREVHKLTRAYGQYCGLLVAEGDYDPQELEPTDFVEMTLTMCEVIPYEVACGFLLQFMDNDRVAEFMGGIVWDDVEEQGDGKVEEVE